MLFREKEGEALQTIIQSDTNVVFITGQHSTGKSSLSKSIFLGDALERNQVAWIDSVEIITHNLLFERALCQWTGHSPRSFKKLETVAEFADQIDQVPSKRIFMVYIN
jgi:AAA+ ATPase superfamily predicted ATPase